MKNKEMNLQNIRNYDQLERWIKENYFGNGINNFVIDGPLNSVNYDKAELKVLFIAFETYGYQNNGITKMSEKFRTWMRDTKKTKTFRYTSLFADMIFYYNTLLKDGDVIPEYSKKDIQNRYQRYDDLVNSMEKIAFINLRKTSNDKSSANYSEINKDININLLSKQIELLDPHIIISTGKLTCQKLNLLDISINSINNCNAVYRINGRTIATINHLSRPNYKYWYNKILEIITSNEN